MTDPEIVLLLREIRDALAPARARLTCEEAGKVLRLSRHALADRVRAGVVRGEITGRAIWISRAEVERMVRDGVPPMPQRTGRPRKVKAGGAYEEIAAKIRERTGT